MTEQETTLKETGQGSNGTKTDSIIVRPSSGESGGPCVLSFFSGKGGVGQSMLAANVAVYLAQTGKRVLLVDAVRWGQNLHTFLGMSTPERTMDALMDREVDDITDVIFDTPYDKLKLLCGMKEAPSSTSATECPYLIQAARKLPFDFAILDLGSHPSFNLFDHTLWSDFAVLTAVPEPTAIEGTYELLRGLYFRLFKTIEKQLDIEEIVNKTMLSGSKFGIRTPSDVVSAVHFLKPEAGDRMAREIDRMRLLLVMNSLRSSSEGDVGSGIVTICKRYFDFNIELLGSVDHDSMVPASIRHRKPLHVIQKEAKCTEQIERIAYKLLSLGILDKQEEAKG